MASICIKCLKRDECESIKWSPDCYHLDCEDFIEDFHIRKKYVLVHHYCESGINSIVAFDDDYDKLWNILVSQPRFGSNRHLFLIYDNKKIDSSLDIIKDVALINICKNVAEYLAVGEYAMLKKSYFKSSAWFEKAKNFASLGSEILNNY